MKSRRTPGALSIASAAAWLLLVCLATQAADRGPNIVFILADDLGYGDLGCYGQEKIRTPNLDRLAAEGIRFTHHYAGSPVCAPSRSAEKPGVLPLPEAAADGRCNRSQELSFFPGNEYAPDRIAEAALQFIGQHKDRPFFLYYPTTVPHLALQVPDDSLAEYLGQFPEEPYRGDRNYLPHRTPRAAYAAMVTRMDRESSSRSSGVNTRRRRSFQSVRWRPAAAPFPSCAANDLNVRAIGDDKLSDRLRVLAMSQIRRRQRAVDLCHRIVWVSLSSS